MKKILISVCLLACMVGICGCEKVGYKEGKYSGSALDTYKMKKILLLQMLLLIKKEKLKVFILIQLIKELLKKI